MEKAERTQHVGDLLFPRVLAKQPRYFKKSNNKFYRFAKKITGMLLDISIDHIVTILSND